MTIREAGKRLRSREIRTVIEPSATVVALGRRPSDAIARVEVFYSGDRLIQPLSANPLFKLAANVRYANCKPQPPPPLSADPDRGHAG